MPRGARLDAPGVLHHVMARGIEGTKIFKDEDDYQDFIERLEKVLEENTGICYAWSLMSNHFHLLIRTETGALVKVMQRLMTGYVVNFNLRHKRAGHLFQNRYNDIIAAEGDRLPPATTSQKTFKMAFILLTAPGVEPTEAEIQAVDNVRRAFANYFFFLTKGRG